MAVRPGFQKTGSLQVNTILPGDIVGGRTAVTLGAESVFALGDLPIGGGAFITANGNQAAVSTSAAGTSVVAGIVLRNQGLSPLSWADSQAGYGFTAPDGSQVSLFIGGKVGALITGVDTSGSATHTPTIGENIWINTTTGAIASAATSVATVTGYIRAVGLAVNQVGMYNATVTIGSDQTLGIIAGNLAGR